MNKRIVSVGLLAALGLGLAACGKDEQPAPTPAAPPAATAPAAATPAAPPPPPPVAPTGSTASAGEVGIAECDDYLNKYEACLNGKVPEAARAALQQSLEATRDAWRQAAGQAQGADALRNACVQAHESTRSSLQAYGCTDF